MHNIPGDIAKMMFPQHTKPIATQLTLSEDGRSLSGHGDYTGGFSGPYRLHFHAEFDRAPRAYGTWRDEQIQAGERSLISDGKGERQHMGAFKRLEYALEKKLIDLFNEPSFLVPQLFHCPGRPDLSAKWLKRITSERFTLTGYPGDDDSGAMSSYYIWAKLGLFSNAGQDIYYLNGPGFDRVTVRRPGHAPLRISRSGPGLYVADVKLDGKALQRSWLRHAELQAATTLEFSMSETPTRWAQQAAPPPSMP